MQKKPIPNRGTGPIRYLAKKGILVVALLLLCWSTNPAQGQGLPRDSLFDLIEQGVITATIRGASPTYRQPLLLLEVRLGESAMGENARTVRAGIPPGTVLRSTRREACDVVVLDLTAPVELSPGSSTKAVYGVYAYCLDTPLERSFPGDAVYLVEKEDISQAGDALLQVLERIREADRYDSLAAQLAVWAVYHGLDSPQALEERTGFTGLDRYWPEVNAFLAGMDLQTVSTPQPTSEERAGPATPARTEASADPGGEGSAPPTPSSGPGFFFWGVVLFFLLFLVGGLWLVVREDRQVTRVAREIPAPKPPPFPREMPKPNPPYAGNGPGRRPWRPPVRPSPKKSLSDGERAETEPLEQRAVSRVDLDFPEEDIIINSSSVFTARIGPHAMKKKTMEGSEVQGSYLVLWQEGQESSVGLGASLDSGARTWLITRRPLVVWALKHPSVSDPHALIVRDRQGNFLIRDLGSSNGTWIDGNSISPGQYFPLRDGARLEFGEVKLRFHMRPASLSDPVTGERWEFLGGETRWVLSRDPLEFLRPWQDNRLLAKQSPTQILNDTVSSPHARIEWRDERFYIRDLGSSNGTSHNNERLASGESRALKIGDLIQLGRQRFRFGLVGNVLTQDQIVDGRYRVEGILNYGGMSVIYRVRDTSPGGENLERAMKALRSSLAGAPNHRNAFVREIKITKELKHPAIVTYIDDGEDERIGPYLILELIDGPSLRDLCNGTTFSLPEAALICRPIAEALAYLCDKGYVHCDVKPDNILLRRSGDPVLVDFGAAQRIGDTEHPRFGTRFYLPRRFRENTRQPIQPEIDLFAMAVVLYEMLTGNRPDNGPNFGDGVATVMLERNHANIRHNLENVLEDDVELRDLLHAILQEEQFPITMADFAEILAARITEEAPTALEKRIGDKLLG